MNNQYEYIYTVHISMWEDDKKRSIGQYMTNASPPHIGEQMNLYAFKAAGVSICKVVDVRITPTELMEQPYLDQASRHTIIHITVVADQE